MSIRKIKRAVYTRKAIAFAAIAKCAVFKMVLPVFTVVRKKDGVVVAEGVTRDVADALILKAKMSKKAALVLA